MTIAAIAILAAGIPLVLWAAYKLLTYQIAQADECAAAEMWLREVAQDKGKTPTLPAPREHLAALVRLLDGLYFQLQELEQQLTQAQQAQEQGGQQAQGAPMQGAQAAPPSAAPAMPDMEIAR